MRAPLVAVPFCAKNAQKTFHKFLTHLRCYKKANGLFNKNCYERVNLSLQGGNTMAFFQSAVDVLQTLITIIGVLLGLWGLVNLMEGYGADNPAAKSQGIKQLGSGVGVVIIGLVLVPLLKTIFVV